MLNNNKIDKSIDVQKIAISLAKKGDNLGLDVNIIKEGSILPVVEGPSVTQSSISSFVKSNIQTADVAKSKAAALEGREFFGKYGAYGFMMANPESSRPDAKSRFNQQHEEVLKASPQEIKDVMSVSASRLRKFKQKEIEARVDQMIANYPDHYGRQINDISNGKTRDGNIQALRNECVNWDYDQIISKSRRPDGSETGLEMADKSAMTSLRRGMTDMSKVLRQHDIQPEFSIDGRALQATKNAFTSVSKDLFKPRSIVRGGIEL